MSVIIPAIGVQETKVVGNKKPTQCVRISRLWVTAVTAVIQNPILYAHILSDLHCKNTKLSETNNSLRKFFVMVLRFERTP